MSEFLKKGRRVGNAYEIIKPIAKGGFSVVYLARFKDTDAPLAVKILRKDQNLDPIWVARFEREASIIRSFSHPNTVRILDFGEEEDFHFIAMEFVQGRSLFKHIRKHGPLSSREVAEITLMVCGAIEEAHTKGVLHRDLKPSNIMLSRTESGFSAKVLDFGSAKILDLLPDQDIDKTTQGHGLQKLTQQGVFVGTPRYAAPEQLLQEHVDIRVDIYGLGMVMWEALVGDPAVPGLDYSTCLELHLGPQPWMLPLAINTEPEFADIVHCALQKKPEDRYQNIRELSSALESFLFNLGELSEFDMSISEASDAFESGPENIQSPPLSPPLGSLPTNDSWVSAAGYPNLTEDEDTMQKESYRELLPLPRAAHALQEESESHYQEIELKDEPEGRLQLDQVPGRRAARRPLAPQNSPPMKEKNSKKNAYFFLIPIAIIALIMGWALYPSDAKIEKTTHVEKESVLLKTQILEKIEHSEQKEEREKGQTLSSSFIISSLRTTGWNLREGDAFRYRDGVTLRTLLVDKKGKKATLSLFNCEHSAQALELDAITKEGFNTVSFGTTFIRWKSSDSGASAIENTFLALQTLQKQ